MRRTKTFEELNDSQRHALDTQRNLAVRAGAGSGKTTVLVERVLQLLAKHYDAGQPLDLGRFAIVTFTRKAAAELQEAVSDGCQQLAEAAPTDAERDWWLLRVEELPRAMIGTIDSLCAGILREYAFLLEGEPRLEPDFAPLEGYETGVLQREAIDRVINRLLAVPSSPLSPPGGEGPGVRGGVFAPARPPTPTLSPEGEREEDRQAEAVRWWATTHGFAALIEHLLALLNHNVEPEVIVAAHAKLPPPSERVAQLEAMHPGRQKLQRDEDKLRASVRQICGELREVKSTAATVGKLGASFQRVGDLLQTPEGARDEGVLGALADVLLTKRGEPRKFSGTKGLPSSLYALQDEWHEALAAPPLDAAAELAAFEAADRLVRLLAPAHVEYRALCQQANQFDFTTLARRTRDLLRASPAARMELQARYRYFLVDEFQDTNFLQWEIISWLVGEGPDGKLDRDRLFIVGDPQQSIYRFRQADVSVFQQVQKVIRESNSAHGHGERSTDYENEGEISNAKPQAATDAQRLGLMPLKENYRSLSPAPLELLNSVFRHVFDPAQHGRDPEEFPFETRYQVLEPGRAGEPAGEVVYLVPPADPDQAGTEEGGNGEDERSGTLSPAQVRAVARELIALHGQPRLGTRKQGLPPLGWGDMAVLLPSRNDVLTALEAEFRLRGVPFVTSKGIGFWQRQEVRDVVSLARWLADPGDELSLFAVLRSPLGQLLDTHILFLSQLSGGSLRRGLRMLKDFDDRLVPMREAEKSQECWQRLPEAIRSALGEVWGRFSAAESTRLRRTAELCECWRQRVDRMAHADMLQSCLEDGGAYAIYGSELDGDLVLANLARVMEHVRTLEAAHATSLARLARRLTDLVDGATREEQAPLADGQDAVQIMTVHAAKGLQFPVVAVMRMERKIAHQDHPKLHVWPPHGGLLPEDCASVPSCSAGVVAVQIRHPERPREWFKSRLFQALADLDQAQEEAEARRLFYVAATRVEERLLLVGKEPPMKKDGQPGRPQTSWQRWFEEALDIVPEHKQCGHWRDPTGQVQMRIVTDASPAAALPHAAAEGKLPPADLEYIHELSHKRVLPVTGPAGLITLLADWEADPRSWWVRHRVNVLPHCPKPRTLDSTAADGETLGAVIGTLVHRLFQMRLADRVAGEQGVLPLLRAMAENALGRSHLEGDDSDRSSSSQADVEGVVGGVRSILSKLRSSASPAREVLALLVAPGEAEAAFALDLGPWRINGRFDKLCRTPDGLEVLDWKTDEAGDPAAIVARYREQMRLYALALWSTGRARVVSDRLTVRLVLLHEPCVESLVFPIAELRDYERRLRRQLAEFEGALQRTTTSPS